MTLPGLLLAALLLMSVSQAASALELTVEISGSELKSEYRQNILLFLSIEREKSNAELTLAQLRRLHRAADREIRAALEPFGYYNPIIEILLENEGGDRWKAIYEVAPGRPVQISQVRFNLLGAASDDSAYDEYLSGALPVAGDAFSHVKYEALKSGLANLANERGYFEASFEQQRVEINRQQNSASIELQFNSGPRYRFGKLDIRGSSLDAELVHRFRTFATGEFFELDRLLDFQQALSDTRYFDSVEVSPDTLNTIEGEVPIQVQLSPRADHLFKLGLGYGTDTGARARLGWEIPRLNPQGHRFDSELKVAEIGYDIFANYRIPVLNPRTDVLSFSAGEEVEEFEAGPSTKRTLGTSLARGRGAWRETLSLEYELEEFEIDGLESDSELLIPGASWSRTWGSEFINVLEGVRFDFSIRAADESLISDINFSKVRAGIKFITPLSSRDRIIMRGTLGSINTDDFERLPSSIRFFAGGAVSVRGYAYNSLGPTDDDGDAIGAENLMVGSVEYEHFFSDQWGLALFIDAGNAIDNFDEDLEQGAGFGFRWKSPVGLIRIDLASAISVDNEWRFHLNIGPDL